MYWEDLINPTDRTYVSPLKKVSVHYTTLDRQAGIEFMSSLTSLCNAVVLLSFLPLSALTITFIYSFSAGRPIERCREKVR